MSGGARSALLGLLCGVIFAIGLGMSGMTDPARVLGFLDFTGEWDPRLGLVMIGAIAVHLTWLRVARRFDEPASVPHSLRPELGVSRALVIGSAVFGVGWGMGGYCPGPAVVSLGLGAGEGALFLAAMLAGMALFQLWATRQSPLRAHTATGIERP